MSLRDAVLEIAEEMEQEVKNPPVGYDTVRSWAKQLRRAVKAAEGSETPQGRRQVTDQDGNVSFLHPDPAVAHRQLIERAKEDMRREKGVAGSKVEAAADKEDRDGQVSIKAVGGSFDGVYLVLNGRPPVSAFVPQGDEVYQYGEDRLLHYHEGQTKRYRESVAVNNPQKKIITG